MRIALTGASSTGKTTLAKALLDDHRFNKYVRTLLKVDARKIIESYNCKNVDEMTRKQLQDFELRYFQIKKEQETEQDNFLSERSFVDIAAYWIVRDTYDCTLEEQEKLIEPCKQQSSNYDLTIYLPFGLFTFESDGYRSENMFFHKQIDNQIASYLRDWNIHHITLDFTDISRRVDAVVRHINVHRCSFDK